MKTKKTLFVMINGIFLFMLLFNGFLLYSVKCSGNYLQSKDIWGISESILLSDYQRQLAILSSLPDDSESAQAILDKTIGLLNQEKHPDPDLVNYLAVKNCYINSINYSTYIQSIKSNSEAITTMLLSLTDNHDSFIRNNLAKSERDHYGLEHLELIPSLDNAVNLLVNDHTVDVLTLAMLTLQLVLFYSFYKTTPPASPAALTGAASGVCMRALLLFLLYAGGMYLSEILIINVTLKLPSLSIPLQSLNAFYVCPYPVSLGAFLGFWLVLKLGSLFLFLLLFILPFLHAASYTPSTMFFRLTGVLFLAVEWYFFCKAGNHAPGIFLREINLFSGFTAERFFNSYLNLNLCGKAVSRLSVFLCFFVILLFTTVFFAYRAIQKLLNQTKQDIEREYLSEIDLRYQEIRRLRHDFNNHLIAVRALYDAGHTEEAGQYIDDLFQENSRNLLPAKTGSNAVDLLLFQKYQTALQLKKNLRFDIRSDLKKHGFPDYDLCSLLGNLLDNALEACPEKTKEAAGNNHLEHTWNAEDEILLSIKDHGQMLFLSCENPYEGERKNENGRFFTTKSDPSRHGIGLSSVEHTCRKYKGRMETHSENGHFIVALLLNDPN